jgi:hypothetical protein
MTEVRSAEDNERKYPWKKQKAARKSTRNIDNSCSSRGVEVKVKDNHEVFRL